MDFHEAIRQHVQDQMRLNNEAIETMVERMLVLPEPYGVLVTPMPDGTVTVELSLDVEPMTITWMKGTT